MAPRGGHRYGYSWVSWVRELISDAMEWPGECFVLRCVGLVVKVFFPIRILSCNSIAMLSYLV